MDKSPPYIDHDYSSTIFQHLTVGPRQAKFDLIEVNANALDVLSIFSMDFSTYERSARIHENNYNGTFTQQNNFFTEYGSSNPTLQGIKSIHLRASSTKKDVVILRNSDLHVWWNDNGEIVGNSSNTPKQAITGVNSSFIEKGIFSSSDNNEDIIVWNQNQIKVYENNNDGYLNTSPIYTHSISGFLQQSNVKVKQVNGYNDEWRKGYDLDDKSDLVYSHLESGVWKIKIYTNDNFNSTSLYQTITFPSNVTLLNFDLDDLNRDGYNELICLAYTSLTGLKFRVYNNNSGSYDANTFYESNNINTTISSAVLKLADFNKNGFKDLVIATQTGYFYIFKNDTGTVEPVATQTFEHLMDDVGDHTMFYYSIDVADIYNLGGLAIVTSWSMSHVGGSSVEIEAIHSTDWDSPPAPVLVFKHILPHPNGKFYPHIKAINFDNRDLNEYIIQRKDYNIGTQWIEIGNERAISDEFEYIDWQRELLIGESNYPNNLFYRVIAKDLSGQTSVPSNQIGYSILAEIGGGEDKPVTENNKDLRIQVYPNPFNPLTNFKLNLPNVQKVKISIYDLKGSLISILQNGFLNEGEHYISFNASNLPSGIYFYKLEAEGKTIINKITLLK